MNSPRKPPYRRLRRILLPAALAGFVVVGLVLASSQPRRTMVQDTKPTITPSDLPPIDQQAPATTETATFALG